MSAFHSPGEDSHAHAEVVATPGRVFLDVHPVKPSA